MFNRKYLEPTAPALVASCHLKLVNLSRECARECFRKLNAFVLESFLPSPDANKAKFKVIRFWKIKNEIHVWQCIGGQFWKDDDRSKIPSEQTGFRFFSVVIFLSFPRWEFIKFILYSADTHIANSNSHTHTPTLQIQQISSEQNLILSSQIWIWMNFQPQDKKI